MSRQATIHRLTDEQRDQVAVNIGLVYRMVHARPRWQKRIHPEEDAVQVGVFALARAVQRFDPEEGVTFATYACAAIWRRLQRAARHQGLVHYPDDIGDERRYQVPTRIRRADRGEGDANPWEPESREEPAVERAHRQALKEVAERLLAFLHPREAEIVRLRYCEGMTLDEVGEMVSLGKERVRQLCARALRRMEMFVLRALPGGVNQL